MAIAIMFTSYGGVGINVVEGGCKSESFHAGVSAHTVKSDVEL